MASTAAPLPNPRVVTTTHTEDGTSVFGSDQVLTPFAPFGPAATTFVMFDSRSSVPVNNMEVTGDLSKTLPRCPPNGIIYCLSNFAPGSSAPMHRTLSLDYGVVTSGEIVLELDSGEEKILKTGDFIVQAGVNHMWHNRTNEICRMVCVMVSAEPIKLADGRVLEETVFKK